MIESVIIGQARKVKFHDARRAFANGATVLVTERDEGSIINVTNLSTTHTRETTDWGELASNVRMWRNRYPNQRFYLWDHVLPAYRDRYTV